jgi:hypothetical protein
MLAIPRFVRYAEFSKIEPDPASVANSFLLNSLDNMPRSDKERHPAVGVADVLIE